MANSVYFYNCIRAIRHTVYGRDNRKPIADAIEKLAHNDTKKLDDMEAKLQTGVHSVIAYPMETWYTYDYRDIELRDTDYFHDKTAEVVTSQISIEPLEELSFDDSDIAFSDADFTWNDNSRNPSNANYNLTDVISEDSVRELIGSEDSYLWLIPNPIKEDRKSVV